MRQQFEELQTTLSTAMQQLDQRMEIEKRALHDAYEGAIVSLQQQLALDDAAVGEEDAMDVTGSEEPTGEAETVGNQEAPQGGEALASMPSCVAGWGSGGASSCCISNGESNG